MARPEGLTPAVVDCYVRHEASAAEWAAIHACVSSEQAESRYYESVCGIFVRPRSEVADASTYDSVTAALAADSAPCAVCVETGAFGDGVA